MSTSLALLLVQHAGNDAWSSVRDDKNQLHHNVDHTYRLIRDGYIDELPGDGTHGALIGSGSAILRSARQTEPAH
jgi:hypothetical protein